MTQRRAGVGALIAAGLLIAACGGSGATSAPSLVPSARAQATQSGHRQVIDVAGVQAAVDALKKNHDSWQFKVTTYQAGTPSFSRNATGTQRSRPATAISLTMTQSGKPDQRFVRVANDVWFDTGTGSYETAKSSDRFVDAQFGQYYLDGIVRAAESEGYLFVSVEEETVSGIATTHYRLADDYIADIVRDMDGITPADWAADLWIAQADGALLRLKWGPQSVDKAQLQAGSDWQVTSIDCDCPVDPPSASPSARP